MEDILPILGFIAYVVFQIISATNRANKKKEAYENNPQPTTQQTQQKPVTTQPQSQKQTQTTQKQIQDRKPQPYTKPPANPLENLLDRIDNWMDKQIEKTETQNQPNTTTRPQTQAKPKTEGREKKKSITYEEKYVSPPVKQRQRIPEPAQSAEITQAPYSNLEEGILDDTHLSKLPHDEEITDGILKNTNRILPDALEGFNPKKAFIHSLIFERKYFKI